MELVQKPDARVLLTIAGQAASHCQTWSKANALTFRDLLQKFHGIKMAARTWHRHYHSLERDGLIRVRHRHITGKNGKLELHSNITILTQKALSLMNRLRKAVTFAAEIGPATASLQAMPKMAFSGTSTSVHRSSSAPPAPQIDQGTRCAPQKTLNTIMERWRSRIQQ